MTNDQKEYGYFYCIEFITGELSNQQKHRMSGTYTTYEEINSDKLFLESVEKIKELISKDKNLEIKQFSLMAFNKLYDGINEQDAQKTSALDLCIEYANAKDEFEKAFIGVLSCALPKYQHSYNKPLHELQILTKKILSLGLEAKKAGE